MYSSEKNPGINWKNIIIKIILFVIFIILLIWLLPKFFPASPNMDALYSNVFRENIKYMQDAARSYYTNDRLPKNVGDKVEMTLQEMINKNLILPFVDKDGNSCDTNLSYVQVTKEEGEYALKVNLVCNDEKSYIIEILGCYDYCEDDECKKEEEEEEEKEKSKVKTTQYQFKQKYTTSKKVLECEKGYTLVGNECYKDSSVKTTDATPIYKTTDKLLAKVSSQKTVSVPYSCTEKVTEEVCTTKYRTKYKTEYYDCSTATTEQVCTTSYTSESYDCNCSTKTVNGYDSYSCDTCYRSVPQESCSTQLVESSSTCQRSVPYQEPYEVCSNETRNKTKTCYRDEVQTVTTCPKGTTTQTGSGANLKCYKLEKTVAGYECPNKDWVYNSTTKMCTLKQTNTKKPTTKTVTSSSYRYTWSTSKTLKGWESTGKTRTVEI